MVVDGVLSEMCVAQHSNVSLALSCMRLLVVRSLVERDPCSHSGAERSPSVVVLCGRRFVLTQHRHHFFDRRGYFLWVDSSFSQNHDSVGLRVPRFLESQEHQSASFSHTGRESGCCARSARISSQSGHGDGRGALRFADQQGECRDLHQRGASHGAWGWRRWPSPVRFSVFVLVWEQLHTAREFVHTAFVLANPTTVECHGLAFGIDPALR